MSSWLPWMLSSHVNPFHRSIVRGVHWDVLVLNRYSLGNISYLQHPQSERTLLSTFKSWLKTGIFHFLLLANPAKSCGVVGVVDTFFPPVQVPHAESVKPNESKVSKSSWERYGTADWMANGLLEGRDSDWKGPQKIPKARIAKNRSRILMHFACIDDEYWQMMANIMYIRSGAWNWDTCDFWYLHLTVHCPSVSHVALHGTLSTSSKPSRAL